MAPNYGYQAKFGIGATAPVTSQIDFISETLTLNQELMYLGGLRGIRDRSIERVREGIRRVAGNVIMQPTAVEWQTLLPWILGGTASGSSYPLGEVLTGNAVSVDRGAKVYNYSNVRVSKATIAGKKGESVKLTLELAGVDETVASSGTFPALTLDTTTTPFVFQDTILTWATVAYQIDGIEIVIDNVLDVERFFNAVTLSTAAGATDRIVSVNFHLPHGDAATLFGTANTGVAIDVSFTNGAHVLDFAFAKAAFPPISPPVEGRGEIMLPMVGHAYRSGATPSLVCTMT